MYFACLVHLPLVIMCPPLPTFTKRVLQDGVLRVIILRHRHNRFSTSPVRYSPAFYCPGIKVFKGETKSRLLIIYISKLTTRKFPNIVVFLSYGIHHTKGLSFARDFSRPLWSTDIKLQNGMLEARLGYPVLIMCDFKVFLVFFPSLTSIFNFVGKVLSVAT